MATVRTGNRGVWGCLVTLFGTIAFAAAAEVVVQDAATAHPGFFVNLPGWAEASAFVFGFLTVVLTLIWIAVATRFAERDRTIVWVTSLLIAPVLIVCAGFALQALPPRYSGECGEAVNAQKCAYLHAHPFAVLALFAGGILAVAVFVGWLSYRSKHTEAPARESRYLELDLHSEAVQRLINQAAVDKEARLGVLLGMDLCALGGPAQALLPMPLVRAWTRTNQADRDVIIKRSTERLERKGQLVPQPGMPGYALSPELGIILAARSRPAYAILAQVLGRPALELGVFGLADGGEWASLAVLEFLVKVPSREFPAPFVPLATVYEYGLVPADRAASMLAEWAIQPVGENGRSSRVAARTLTRYQPSGDQYRINSRISVHGDGTTARVAGLDPAHPKADRACGRDELAAVVTELLAGKPA